MQRYRPRDETDAGSPKRHTLHAARRRWFLLLLVLEVEAVDVSGPA